MTAAYQPTTTVPDSMAGVIIPVAIVAVVAVIIGIAGMWRMFTKAGRPGWAAIVPFYNTYVLVKIAGRPGWWLLLFLVPVVNLVAWIVLAVDVARSFGRGVPFAIFGVVLFSPVGYAILGFGGASYLGPAAGSVDSSQPRVDPDGTPAQPRTRWDHPALLGATALAVAAAAVAVWFGVAWISAGNDDSLNRAKVRDDVSRIAEQAIETFNTLDYRKADEGLDTWLAVSTGPLHDEVVGRRESGKKAIENAKNVTSAEVRALAVTDLNEFDGTATVIAAVRVLVTPEGKQTTEKWLPIQGALTRTPDGWKLANLGQVNFAS